MFLASVAAVFGVIVVTLAAFGAGFWIEKRVGPSFSPVESVAFQFLAGLGILSLTLFLSGQIAYTRVTIAGTIVVSAVLGIRSARKLWRESQGNWRLSIGPIPAAVLAGVLAVTAVAGLAEIIGDWENDAIAYHLLGPKVWLRDGIIRPLPDTSTTAFPSTAEVIFGALFKVGGNRAPGLFAVVTLACFLVVVYSLARGAGLGERKSWWAAAFAAAMPAVYVGAHSGFIDVLYATFILGAARIGFEAETPGDFFVFGIFCGFGIATKYTGLTALPALIAGAVIALALRERSAWIAGAKGAVIASVAALAIGSPYFVRNWIVLGFPIYPLPPGISNVVAVKYFSPDALRKFHAFLYMHAAKFGTSPRAFLMLPYNLTYHTSLFSGAGGIGLTGLALGPFGLLAKGKRAFVKALALLGFLLVMAWFFTLQESRYLIPAYPIAAVFGALGWEYVERVKPRFSGVLCGTVIACSLLYGLFMIGTNRWNDLHRAVSPAFAETEREQKIPYLRSFEYLNAEPAVKRVLVLDRSVPTYYLEKDYLKPFGQWGEQVLPEAGDAGAVLREVRTLKVSHVLDVKSVAGDFQVPEGGADLELVFEAKNQRVYRVK